MYHTKLPAFFNPPIEFQEIRKYLKEHWFKILLISLGLYVLLVKDINFQLSMNSAGQQGKEAFPADFWEKEVFPRIESAKGTSGIIPTAQQGLSLLSAMVSPDPSPAKAEVAAQPVKKEPPKPKKTKDPNLANTFSNLTFVLSPTYAQRKNIPAEIVEEKIKKCNAYVRRFAPVAVAEMKKYGIPASITLAQGLLESNVGESRLGRANNNHFGIKCFSRQCRKGHCSNFTDDTHKDFFRVYQSAWESYRAHSIFLQGKRYRHLQKLGTKNYRSWAHGLRKAGYATDKRYAEKLIQIIEFLDLDKYDK